VAFWTPASELLELDDPPDEAAALVELLELDEPQAASATAATMAVRPAATLMLTRDDVLVCANVFDTLLTLSTGLIVSSWSESPVRLPTG
jgi:hypothetical protein